MIHVVVPVALWTVAGFMAVVRFLSYMDLRIRNEGWEVELLLRAAAERLQERGRMNASDTDCGALLPVFCIDASASTREGRGDRRSRLVRCRERYAPSPRQVATGPGSARLSEPKSPRDWTWQPPDFRNRRLGFRGVRRGAGQGLQIVAWVLLVWPALWFVLFVLRSYRDLELGKKPDSDKRSFDRTIDVEKLADLPFDAPQAGGDLLSTIRAEV